MENAKDIALEAFRTLPGWAREYLLPTLAWAVAGVICLVIVGVVFANRLPGEREPRGQGEPKAWWL